MDIMKILMILLAIVLYSAELEDDEESDCYSGRSYICSCRGVCAACLPRSLPTTLHLSFKIYSDLFFVHQFTIGEGIVTGLEIEGMHG